jgi:hypothetical protein
MIEVVRAANIQEFIRNPDQRLALVSDVRWDVEIPHYALDDIQGITGFILERFL